MGLECADDHPDSDGSAEGLSRRRVLSAMAASAVAAAAAPLLGRLPSAAATPPGGRTSSAALSLSILGTNAGPPPLADRYGVSSALVVNGKTYVVDCGRGSVTQFLKAGLSMPSLTGIFLTHLHADHVVDYFSYPLLSAGAAGAAGFAGPVGVYGPGGVGRPATVASATGAVPGTVEMTRLLGQAFAASPTYFMTEHAGIDPLSTLQVHDVLPPASVGATMTNTAPAMQPFPVMEDDNVKVTAVLVPHGAVYPSYAYRFDTDHGSVVFSGDTAPTPNIPTLAQGADVLVHEATYTAALAGLGLPPALLQHIKDVHTEVGLLGGIAAQSQVGTLVANHLGPGDPSVVSDATWRALLRDSARAGGFRGEMVLGTDLLQLPVVPKRR